MRYIDEVELELVNNKYRVKFNNFRTTFYKEFKDLFDKGYIDWKGKITHSFKGIGIDSNKTIKARQQAKKTTSGITSKEINKSLRHINADMEKSAEEFYTTKKEKDDNLSL